MTRRYQKQCHSKNGFSTPAKADEEIARTHRGRAVPGSLAASVGDGLHALPSELL